MSADWFLRYCREGREEGREGEKRKTLLAASERRMESGEAAAARLERRMSRGEPSAQ